MKVLCLKVGRGCILAFLAEQFSEGICRSPAVVICVQVRLHNETILCNVANAVPTATRKPLPRSLALPVCAANVPCAWDVTSSLIRTEQGLPIGAFEGTRRGHSAAQSGSCRSVSAIREM